MGSKFGSLRKPPEDIIPETPPRNPLTKNTSNSKILKALYNFDSSTNEELSFKKNDLLQVIDDTAEDWWLVKCMSRHKSGYVPYNYVVLQDSIQDKSWFHGKISRKDCEKLLESRLKQTGEFLIRESESIENTYSLSVLCSQHGENVVKHYHLRRMDKGSWYISPGNSFDSLEDLIDFYSHSKGLGGKLGQPCQRLKPVMTDLSRTMKDKWEIDRGTLQTIEKLGSGNFGEVWKAVCNGTTIVAIKMLKSGVANKERFLEEAANMKRLRHPKLIRLYGVCTECEPLYIVTEYMAKGCLQDVLKKDKGQTMTWNCLLEFATQIASGMGYIESQGYIHRDLATRNILVDEYMLVKIGDFGLSKALFCEDVYTSHERTKFPVKWTDIEAVTSKKFTIKSDVWSFGILLVELATYGACPYPGLSNEQVLAKLRNNYRHPKPDDCPDEIYELMMSCWHKDPARRPTFDHLYYTLDDFYVATQSQYEG